MRSSDSFVGQALKVAFIEPWYGGSHRRFLDGLVEHSRHEIWPVTMAGRYWRWRMQGGAVTLSEKLREVVEERGQPDVLMASSMANLPAVMALARKELEDVPTLLLFHENQLTYPLPEDRKRDVTYAYINYLSALAADKILFNSHFHEEEFFMALPDLLRRFPDYTHVGTLPDLHRKSDVAYLGLDLEGLDAARPAAEVQRSREPGPPVILWNHRWEYDKNPEAFFRVMNRLDDSGRRFRLILAGKTFAQQPEEFEKGFRRYAERVLHYGYAESFHDYAQLLHRADIVISTSIHEFFGIAMLEAIYCGCHPLLPNRLTYPELIPEALHQPLLHAPVLYEDEEELFKVLCSILDGEEERLPTDVLESIPAHLSWPEHVTIFDEQLEQLANRAEA